MSYVNKQYVLIEYPLRLVISDDQMERVIDYRKTIYASDREEVMDFYEDGYDEQSYVLYAEDENGELNSTGRLLLDTEKGFPEESILPDSVLKMREDGLKIAELGRFAISGNKTTFLRLYYKAVYELGHQLGIDVVLIVMKRRNLPSHKKIMSISILSEQMGHSWDEEQGELALVAWHIKDDQPKFLRWTGATKPAVYTQKEWNFYSDYHLGVLTSVQHEVYQALSNKAFGQVLDAGCGSARVMAYMKANPKVNSYTGVDFSEEMIQKASWLKDQLHYQDSRLLHTKIESLPRYQFDTIVSIQSFYSWPDPAVALQKLYDSLSDDGVFMLITPNNQFDREQALQQLVKREVLGHPYFEPFLEINQNIADKAQSEALYPTMDELIQQVRAAGFQIQACHNEFFLGGVAYIEATKLKRAA